MDHPEAITVEQCSVPGQPPAPPSRPAGARGSRCAATVSVVAAAGKGGKDAVEYRLHRRPTTGIEARATPPVNGARAIHSLRPKGEE
jgi:hypothetical protein